MNVVERIEGGQGRPVCGRSILNYCPGIILRHNLAC